MNDADDFAAATSASNLTCCEGHVVGMPYFGQEHGGMLFFQWVYLVADTRHLTRRPCLPVCVCVCVLGGRVVQALHRIVSLGWQVEDDVVSLLKYRNHSQVLIDVVVFV